jgi:excisionase family DNA binding protein
MLPSTTSRLQSAESLEAEDHNRTKSVKAGEPTSPTVLAYIFLLPDDATPILDVLRTLASSGPFQNPINFQLADAPHTSRESDDLWLGHSTAAHYLGISRSTLYRYAEQGRIESRKLGNRLEYRRSTLDNFKNQNIRPACSSVCMQCIIPSAPVSGK